MSYLSIEKLRVVLEVQTEIFRTVCQKLIFKMIH